MRKTRKSKNSRKSKNITDRNIKNDWNIKNDRNINTNRNIKDIVINISIAIAVIIIFLVMLEIFFRIKYPMVNLESKNIIYDDYLCLRGRPNITINVKEPEYSYSEKINSYGIRGPDPVSNMKTIVFIGDSFVYGAGAKDNETMPYVLSSLINEKNVQVINLGGMGGYPAAYYRVLNWSINALPNKPDIAIIGIYEWNDADNQNEMLFLDNQCPVVVEDGKIVKSPDEDKSSFISNTISYLNRHSSLFVMISRSTARSYTLRKIVNSTGLYNLEPIPYYMRIFKKNPDADVERQYKIFGDIIQSMNNLANDNDITIYYVLIPTKFQVYPQWWQRFQKSYHLDNNYDPNVVDQKMISIMKSTNSTYLSLHQIYYNYSDKDLYYTIDEHCTPKGYKLFTESIYEEFFAKKV